MIFKTQQSGFFSGGLICTIAHCGQTRSYTIHITQIITIPKDIKKTVKLLSDENF